MKWKEILSDYLSFSRRDRLAIGILLLLILVIFFVPAYLGTRSPAPVPADTSWMAAVRQLEQASEPEDAGPRYQNNRTPYKERTDQYNREPKRSIRLFYFDPNTVTDEGWRELGLRDKTIQTIRNFLSKGGLFRKPEDLQKIYGLFPDEYERLVPFIRIEALPTANTEKANTEEKPSNRPAPTARFMVIDINLADTIAWIALPGIGSKLAARIVNFREKLGGFYAISQVAETFGLADSVFQKIRPFLKIELMNTRKININQATADELKTHPYIRYNLANALVAYRKEHGPFVKMEDIKKLMAVTEEIYLKLSPYLSL
jgi:competence protein ComEA